ncbi:hypothetical protein Q9R32_05510 [Actinotalea sp. AC32]|nr:hypothetical protein [Actinotalea sp. AC32]
MTGHAAHRAGSAALVLAALVVGQVVRSALPSEDAASAPFERVGDVGEPVPLRYATVTVGAAEGSTVVEQLGTSMSTTGVWLSVPVTITAHGEPRTLAHAEVRDDQGRTFLAQGTRSSFLPGTVQAGMTRRAWVTVELPVEAAAGAELVLGLRDDHRLDDVAVVDLGVTGADARRWAATTEPLTIPQPEDVGVGEAR